MTPGPADAADALRAMTAVDLAAPGSVYWALRSVLVSARHEIPIFDGVFARFWDAEPAPERPARSGADMPGRARARRRPPPAAARGEAGAQDVLVRLSRTGATTGEVDREPDLAALAGQRAGRVVRVAARVVDALAERPGRRLRPSRRRGQVHLRGVLRRSLSGGEVPVLPRRVRAPRRPRIVMLLDASGSMDRHAGLMLELAWALAQRAPRLEAYAFSTSVSRIGPLLRTPSYEEALSSVGEAVHHWSGGTMIGESLARVRSQRPDLLERGANVFVVSDGWDTGEPERLARELRRVRRRVRRLIWLNPLLGSEGYEQATRSLVAARDCVDLFASIRDIGQLRRLPDLLSRPPQGRARRGA